MATFAPPLGVSALASGMGSPISPLPSDQLAAGAIAGSVVRGGAPFSDTLTGLFYPIVIDAAGNVTINASTNHPGSMKFHNTNVSLTDVLLAYRDVAGPQALMATFPNTSTPTVHQFGIIDANTYPSGSDGIVILASSTRVSIIRGVAGSWTNIYQSDPTDTFFGTFSGLLASSASTTARAGINAPHGTAPTSPVNGDIWTTTAGMFVRINGATKTVTLT